MDANILKAFEDKLNQDFVGAIISNSSNKEKVAKIKIRPILLKGELYFQTSEFIGEKVFHSNYKDLELIAKLPEWFEGLFKQAEITTKTGSITLLISKKGKATVKYRVAAKAEQGATMMVGVKTGDGETDRDSLSHNKKKNYILSEGEPLPFLVDLGVMTETGAIIKAKSDKFRQLNRFLEYIEDILPFLDKTKELTILDFGCGKSYLTFAMYYYLRLKKGYRINVIGLDLKSDVIMHCNALSQKYGYDKLYFLQGDIASYEGADSVDMVVTLHACDTATDHALYKAVSWGAKVILSVPCCQHELNKQINCEVLQPVLRYGIISERISALITDALRAEFLETMGYRVQLLEFIDMEHTPKNILIRAVLRKKEGLQTIERENQLEECMDFLGVNPSLKGLLQQVKAKEGN